MRLKKILAAVCTFAMALSFAPTAGTVNVMADTPAPAANASDGLVLSKTAEIQDDGTYTINLEAYATGVTNTEVVTKQTPLDIVLVLDQSGSMAFNFDGDNENTNSKRRQYAMKNAVNAFIDNVASQYDADEADHRISIVTFESSAKNLKTWTTVDSTGQNSLKQAVNGLPDSPSGATNVAAGMTNAKAFVNTPYNGSNPDRKKVVIVFTDGVPTTSRAFSTSVATNSIKTAKELKDAGVIVYSVGIFNGADPAKTYGDDGFTTNSNGSVGSHWASGQFIINFGDVADYDVPAGNRFLNYLSSNYADATEIGLKTYSRNFVLYTSNGWEITKNFDRTNNQFYLTAADAEGLNNVFESISSTITSGSTSVTLDQTAVMRDILSDSFVLPEGYNAASSISAKTVAGTADVNGNITWGAANNKPSGISVSADVETSTIDVTGFNYSEKFITNAHPGEKLVVTITGIVPAADCESGDNVPTNKDTSGVYAKVDDEIATIPTATFPVPSTAISGKAYVLDYAKTAELTDEGVNYKGVVGTPAKITASDSSWTGQYGSVILSSGKASYTPNTMNWGGYDKFFMLGKSSVNKWSKVAVIPANNVYYDDDFITSESNGTTGIEYTGDWDVVAAADSTENVENAEDAENPAFAAQGWIDALDGASADSNGSIHSIEAAESMNNSMATFTFTGTGFDIYGRTSKTSGTVMVNVKGNGINKTKIIDTISESTDGFYYQIPTCSFSGLARGEYTVKVYVTKAAKANYSATEKDRFVFYMDGVRIYNPVEEDATVQEAYGPSEVNAEFTQIREAMNFGGVVFIDKDKEGTVSVQKEYDSTEYGKYGPKNEVYLAKDQAISFKVDTSKIGNSYYVGIKAPEGQAVVTVTNGAGTSDITVGTSDLYYKVTPTADGMIEIKNKNGGLVSLTKLKSAGVSATAQMLYAMDADAFLAYADAFDTLEVIPYDNEVVEAPAEEVPEVTAPAENENINNVVVENPVEEAPEVTAPVVEKSWIASLLSKFAKFFR